MDTFYKLSSVDPEVKCNIVNPFYYQRLEGEINPVTKRVMTLDDINAVKQSFIRINNSHSGNIELCCDPKIKESDINAEYMAQFKEVFPHIREIRKNGELQYIELSRIKQNPKNGFSKSTTNFLIIFFSSTNHG